MGDARWGIYLLPLKRIFRARTFISFILFFINCIQKVIDLCSRTISSKLVLLHFGWFCSLRTCFVVHSSPVPVPVCNSCAIHMFTCSHAHSNHRHPTHRVGPLDRPPDARRKAAITPLSPSPDISQQTVSSVKCILGIKVHCDIQARSISWVICNTELSL